ncbi:MAG: bifunctional hydroxymethylpyrimidine kinase/phosphomethylpyrimidine kinase [Methanotrichaceae archaeon]|nr:bifunctional hydroxymethylpyrimidine kinase/phosphomethylpyrimidine kinase [Methanotrichaceae archaeon]
MRPVVLTIGGSDSGGGAGIQADIKTFSILGCHGTCVITAITAQNTLGVQKIFDVAAEAVSDQLESIIDDFQVSFAKTGMLYSADIVRAVAKKLDDSSIPIVLDPVIEAEAGGRLLRPEAIGTMKDLLIPQARVVTPNIFEASDLTGIHVRDLQSMEMAARAIIEMGAEAVIVKGGHLNCTDLLMKGENVYLLRGQRVKGGNHGVGCTFSAALMSYLAKGRSLKEAAEAAKDFAVQAISRSIDAGKGVAPVNPAGCLIEKAERFEVFSNVQSALKIIKEDPGFVRHVHEMGSNIGMAIPEAVSLSEVAALEGGLIRAGEKVHQSGCIKFGCEDNIPRIVLTIMRFDPRCRAAMNLSPDCSVACKRLKLNLVSLKGCENESNTSSMRLNIAEAIKMSGHPYAIFDAIGLNEEPMLMVVGQSAIEVANVATRLFRPCNKENGKI